MNKRGLFLLGMYMIILNNYAIADDCAPAVEIDKTWQQFKVRIYNLKFVIFNKLSAK